MNNRSNTVEKSRSITEFQELVFRLRHHEHFGRSTEETAAILETSPSSVRNALSTVRRTSPQLFPILSRKDWTIWRWWTEHGRTAKQVAEIVDLPYGTVRTKLERTRKKLGVKIYDTRQMPDVRYEESMDGYIKERF